jgi:predicted RNA binding protein YcfA (HicA-like mRNA interferase family)
MGFTFKRKEGSHEQWYRPADARRKAAIVTLDRAYSEIGDPRLIQSMVRQSGFTKDEFYGATKKTARKASVEFWLASTPETD